MTYKSGCVQAKNILLLLMRAPYAGKELLQAVSGESAHCNFLSRIVHMTLLACQDLGNLFA